MYIFLKKVIKLIVPLPLLFKNELFLRSIYGLFYKGNTKNCNICNEKLKKFILLENNELLCPFCGSLSRNRRLWMLLTKNNHLKGNLLHFSASRNLYRKLKKIKNIDYYSTDFENEFLADYKFDITNINQPNEKFNTIICYHILEHIIEDIKAMSELYRVLKKNGVMFVQTPFKEGDLYEDYSITSKEDRLKHFGQFDHVRIYSVKDLKARLESVGFNVTIKNFTNNSKDAYYGYKSPETILILNK